MWTTYTTGGKTNPPSCSRVFSPQTRSVWIQFLSFFQLELRTQPSYQTWTTWHRGLWSQSLKAARFLLRSEPRWGWCRGPATCTVHFLHKAALNPLTPLLSPKFPPHSRGMTSSCQHLHRRLILDAVATNNSIPPLLQLPQAQNLTSDSILSALWILTRGMFSFQSCVQTKPSHSHNHGFSCGSNVALHWAKESNLHSETSSTRRHILSWEFIVNQFRFPKRDELDIYRFCCLYR